MARRHVVPSALLVAVSLITGSCTSGEPIGAGLGPSDPADVATVELSPGEVVLSPGQRKKLDVTLRNDQGEPLPDDSVAWSTDDGAVATVDASGEVVAVAYGETSIRAERGRGKGRVKVRVADPVVAGIAVTPSSATLVVGEDLQLSATSVDGTGTIVGTSVAWSSSAPDRATVDANGKVHGIAPGSVQVVAATGTVADTANLTVNQAPVATVEVTPGSATLVEGQKTQLTAAVVTTAGDTLAGSASWSSLATGTATVSSAGMVTAVNSGTARIVAAAGGLADTALVSVSEPPPSSISISPGSATVMAGATVQLSAQVTDAQGNPVGGAQVSWSSSATGVATVSSGGLVSGVTPGTATIRATSGSLTAQATVTVTPVPVATVSVSPASPTLAVGATQQLTATVRDADGNVLTGRTVTWSSAATAVATVSASGLVTARGEGTSAVTATVEGKSASAAVTVEPPPVASVTVTPSAPSLETGETVQLQVTLKDAQGNVLGGRSVSWSSSRTATATVSGSGLVSATGAGTATITATAEGKSGSSSVTVTDPPAPVATVSVSPASPTLAAGATQQLSATARDADGNVLTGRTITWQSNSTAVATVSASGLVTAQAQGSATVTATVEGKVGSASVTVTAGGGGGTRAGWYVSPSGTSGGSGSAASPWSLQAALSHPGAVQPGDTIWLRGGTYRGTFTSQLAGTSGAPIIVRQYPGERATLEGTLAIQGRDAWYWGFEVANTNTGTQNLMGVSAWGPRTRLINLVVHDHSGNGIGHWAEAPDGEVYGCLCYNNGFRGSTSSTYGHGIYAQNATGAKRMVDNIVFQSFGYGFHLYTEGSYLRNFTLDGNVAFNNAMRNGNNFLVGGGTPVEGLVFRRNMTYQTPGFGNGGTWVGRNSAQNRDAVVEENYLVHGSPVFRLYNWSSITVRNNVLVGLGQPGSLVDQQGGAGGYTWSGNRWYGQSGVAEWNWGGQGYTFSAWRQATGLGSSDEYLGTQPSGVQVFVRPNQYEPGRATVVVYNWSGASSTSVSLAGVLPAGTAYVVKAVENYYGAPVASGTFGGGSISVPLGGTAAPTPIGGWPSGTPTTGRDFNVFIVQPAGS